MAGITVTIYNDDEFGRDFQVTQLSTLHGWEITHNRQCPEEDDGSKCCQYKLRDGDMLIITPTGS